MPNWVQYRKPADTTRTPSPIIWADCPTLEIIHDPSMGIHIFDEFLAGQSVDQSDSLLSYGQWSVSSSTGVTFNPLIANDFGVNQIANNDADEDGFCLWKEGFARHGATLADQCWFEARIKVPSVADSTYAWFLGWIETTVAPTSVATLVDDTGVLNTSEDFIGFHVLDADGDDVDCIYQEGAQTNLVNVGGAIDPIVAGTFYKFGMRYQGGKGLNGVGLLEYYLDGTIVQTLDITTALDFPDVNHLGPILAHKTTAAGAIVFDIDWMRAAAVGGNT